MLPASIAARCWANLVGNCDVYKQSWAYQHLPSLYHALSHALILQTQAPHIKAYYTAEAIQDEHAENTTTPSHGQPHTEQRHREPPQQQPPRQHTVSSKGQHGITERHGTLPPATTVILEDHQHDWNDFNIPREVWALMLVLRGAGTCCCAF